MIIEIDELDLRRYSPATLRAVRPDLLRVANIMRQNLRHLDRALEVDALPPADDREKEGLRRGLHEAQSFADALRDDLDQARARIADLERRLAAIEDDEVDALYASVGLVPTAHGVVVHAARRALLQHLHPDRAPEGQPRAVATAKFQKASAAFDQIIRLRY